MGLGTAELITLLIAAVTTTGVICSAVLKIVYDFSLKSAQASADRSQDALFNASISVRNLQSEKNELTRALERVRQEANAAPPATGSLDELRQKLEHPDFDMWSYAAATLTGPRDVIVKRVPVVTIINLKGGVGKSTLSSSLAAYLTMAESKRVLIIDIDYQGSLTNSFRRAWVSQNERMPKNGFASGAPGFWLQPTATPSDVVEASFDLDSLLRKARLLEADYPFFALENRVYLQWVIRATHDDVRYRLAKLLHSDEVANRFDFVVIDAPPRLSLGAVNAMFASTHFVVPTILDRLSIEPIELLLNQITELFPEDSCPEFLGALPTLTYQSKLSAFEKILKADLQRTLSNLGYKDPVFESFVPKKAELSKLSGVRIPYKESGIVREIFDPVCSELIARMRASKYASDKIEVLQAAE
jgi:cellulose biosynthesis protein BcsQ